MFYVNEIQAKVPCLFQAQFQAPIYGMMKNQQLPFSRIDTDEAVLMENCAAIDEKPNMNNTLGVARVSSTPAGQMGITPGTKIGAAQGVGLIVTNEKELRAFCNSVKDLNAGTPFVGKRGK